MKRYDLESPIWRWRLEDMLEDMDDFEDNLKAVFGLDGVDLGPSEPPSLERLKGNLEALYPNTDKSGREPGKG